MELSVNLFMTLDGVSQGPGGAEEDPRNGFTSGGWFMPYFDAGCGENVGRWFSNLGEFLLGRFTYDVFAGHWPKVTDPADETAKAINSTTKNVVTSRVVDNEWNDTTNVLGDDFLDRIQDLKSRDLEGELQVHGSVQLARTLHEAGLIDTYRFLIAPVVLGSGFRIFDEAGPAKGMTVVHRDITESGVVALDLKPRPFVNNLTPVVEDGKEVLRENDASN